MLTGLYWKVHPSPKDTQVLEGCISFEEECISVNLTSCVIYLTLNFGPKQDHLPLLCSP